MERINTAILARKLCLWLKRDEARRPGVTDAPALNRFVVVGHAEGRSAGHEEVGDRFDTHGHADAAEPPVIADDIHSPDPERRAFRQAALNPDQLAVGRSKKN